MSAIVNYFCVLSGVAYYDVWCAVPAMSIRLGIRHNRFIEIPSTYLIFVVPGRDFGCNILLILRADV